MKFTHSLALEKTNLKKSIKVKAHKQDIEPTYWGMILDKDAKNDLFGNN